MVTKLPITMTGAQLTRIRHRLKMSQPAFAAALGTTAITVSRWETGRQTITPPTAMLFWYIRRYGLPQ